MLRAFYEAEEPVYEYTAQDEERLRKRRERINEMKRQKERQLLFRKLTFPIAAVAICIVIIVTAGGIVKKTDIEEKNIAETNEINETDMSEAEAVIKTKKAKPLSDMVFVSSDIMTPFSGIIQKQMEFVEAQGLHTLGGKSKEPVLTAQADKNTIGAVGDAVSKNFVFIDVNEKRILAQQDAKTRISPASMTKILTVLVAAEHITDEKDTFEITRDITDYSFSNGCSNTGFEVGERVTVEDLFYGTILPSGADAAVGLAKYVSGTHEGFVELMNEKLAELGLDETSHFTNCVGLYDENHYSTAYDMAVILKAAYDNEFCREVLSKHIYTTTATQEHPEGITLSNLFLRRIEDSDTHGEVLCAKTGYVVQSENCAASLSVGNDGKLYICVTAHSNGPWRCIKDHVAFYQHFLPEQ